ncbi:MAG: hypothetical protein ABIS50_10695 [Luteolibacter sp.]|uniref:hypothetical protein n=1 Tax=Luteolibacter sp. TaxID=1962973 RepID=UPI0032661856
MDKEQARFILRSFRPDGADAADQDFAEALKLALENRELGEWLAHERAFDAAFAHALGSIDLPGHLREDILACLAVERGDFPQAEDSADAAWIGALASIQPPANLRADVLAAMDRTLVQTPVAKGKISIFRRAAIPLAAAAGIALAFLITRPANPTATAQTSRIPIDVVQAGFIRTFESPTFDLEEKNPEHLTLIQHLKDKALPSPSCLPPGLGNVAGLGCRELLIDGKRGSLICFNRGDEGLVHMVIFRREDLEGTFPDMTHPEFARNGEWSSARWQHGDNVFLLMENAKTEKLAALFSQG